MITSAYKYGAFHATLVAQKVKDLRAMWETQVRSLGQDDPLERGMATHFSILSWRILRKLAVYSPLGYKDSDTTGD